MMLACECETGATEFFEPARDFAPLDTKRGRRCSSCKKLIKVGEDCLRFLRYRYAKNDIEERIYGEGHAAVDMPCAYLCESCGGLYMTFEDLGYCVQFDDNMRDLVKDYNEQREWY